MNRKMFANLIENAEKEVKLYLGEDTEKWGAKRPALFQLVNYINHEFDSNIIYLVDLEYNAGNLEESLSFYWEAQWEEDNFDEDDSDDEKLDIKEAIDGVNKDANECLKNIEYIKKNLDWFCQPGVNHYLHTTEW